MSEPLPSRLQADGVSGMDRMLEAKLWGNPCWFAFRLNYLALRYNRPLYDWIRRTRGLSRPEYVALYSIALCERGQACDIADTSGFPKNTLSRAIARLEALGLLTRAAVEQDRRAQSLMLSAKGRKLFDDTLPAFVAHERTMLTGLTEAERATLSRLLAKVVLGATGWPMRIESGRPSGGVAGAEGDGA